MQFRISGVQVIVTKEKTGETLNTGREIEQSGNYEIVNDLFKGKLSRAGEILAVVGKKDNQGFQTQFEIRGGACHIAKIFGPDVVTLK